MAVCFDFCSKSFMILTVYISFYVAIHRHEVLSAPDNTFSPYCMAVFRPTAELFTGPTVLLWARPPGSVPYRPCTRSVGGGVLTCLLLLLGGVEQNPGPAAGLVGTTSTTSAASSALRLGIVNARSAVHKAALIHDVIGTHRLDLLVVTETWMSADQPSAIILDVAPPDYAVVHRFRPVGVGGGVAIIHHRNLRVSTVQLTSAVDSLESLVVKLITRRGRVNVAALYRPPTSSSYGISVSSFCIGFADYLDELLSLPGELLLCGDLNCPGVDAVSIDPLLEDVLFSRQLVQHVDGPTHDAGNLLDLVITVEQSTLCGSPSILTGISDHNLVLCELSDCRPKPVFQQFKYRSIKVIDPVVFAAALRRTPVYLSPSDDVDAFADQLEQSIRGVLDELAPMKTCKKRRGRRSNRWLSASAISAKRERRRREKRWRMTRCEADRHAYRSACRHANAEIDKSRQSFYQQRLDTATGNHSSQWKTVRELLHIDNQREEMQPEEARRLCIQFSRFFANKLLRIADQIKARLSTLSRRTASAQRPISVSSLNVFGTVTDGEVARVIHLLRPKSSPLDCLPTSLLKASVDVMAPLLSHLANLSFSSGTFPQRYKLGHVIPLLKKPGLCKDDPANFRPITNLSTFSKILEKLVLSRLRPHVLSSVNFNRFQSAYRPGYSTETALLKVVGDIERAADEGKCTVLLALDISAAFDAVDHSILCRRAERDFGISGTALAWLRSFVTGRSQYVAVGIERSETTALSSGVPQGSILGPLLFALYVSPIDDIVLQCGLRYHQYADDLMLYFALVPSMFTDLSLIVSCTEAVSSWFLENSLLLNADKTEAVIFGTRQRLISVDGSGGVTVDGTIAKFVDAVKLLGVTLDSPLTFNQHVTNVARACTFHTRALRHIRPLLTIDAAKLIASAIVGSRLDYCNSLLFGTSERNLDRLQRVQNTLARVVLQAPWSVSATDLRRQLHWLPVRQRIHFKLATITYKTMMSDHPSYLHDQLCHHQSIRSLRSSTAPLLQLPPVKTVFAARAFSAAAPKLWNSLSARTRSANTSATFRSSLKTELFSAAYY